MIRYHTHDRAPHLTLELHGIISEEDLRSTLADLPTTLASLPADFVLLTTYADVLRFRAHAIGQLFYYVARIFDADPQLCVFVNGKSAVYPGLRLFIEKIGRPNQVAFVSSRADADDRIRALFPHSCNPFSGARKM